jgi:hypothetical protein
MASKKETITSDQATRGIYLDFEGKMDQPPMMCGVMVEGDFSQVVFEEGFEPAVGQAHQVKGWPIQMADLDTFLVSLVERAIKEDRHLIAFSNHELAVLKEIEGIDERVADRYINALPIIKRWRIRVHPVAAKAAKTYREWCKENKETNKKARKDYHNKVGRRLIDYLKLIGVKVSTAHAPGKQTARMAAILSGLKRTSGEYAGLTPTQKGKWTKLLNHNESDVVGLRSLMA